MTTLNTIIEEEKNMILAKKELHNEAVYWFGIREFETVISSAMQRAYEAGRAEERLGVVELLHTYAMKTKTTEALDLIESAQRDILSKITHKTPHHD